MTFLHPFHLSMPSRTDAMTNETLLLRPPAPEIEPGALRSRALVLTATVWLFITVLLVAADIFAGGSIGRENWWSIVTSFPLVMLAGWINFRAVVRFFRSHGVLLLWFMGTVIVTGLVETAKDVWLLDMFGAKRPSFVSMVFRSFAFLVLLLGVLAAIAATWVESAQRLLQERALSGAREAEAAARLAASQAESAAVEARLSALRYQLNPHFLFNTLNAISSMVVTGRNEAAEGMLDRLCDFLRATLSTRTSGLVPIEDELATMASYLEIENFRLRDRLTVEFICPPGLVTALVPGFMLQPLIENAIKHGVGRSSRPVNLRIEVETHAPGRLRISVSDDAVPDLASSGVMQGFGLGLGNVAERLQSLYGADARLDTRPLDAGYVAELDLPLVTLTEDAAA